MATNEPISNTPRKLRLFLCHSADDKPLVRDLYSRLRADKIDAWLDEEDLVPGQDWELEILRAVRAADIVVVCLSKRSVNKTGFVQKEIKLALDVADTQPEGTIFLIPVRVEKCDVPDRLRRWHWVNLYEEEGYARLIRAISVRLSQIIGSSCIISKSEESESSNQATESETIEPRTETEIHNDLLRRWNRGDKEARDELLTREYPQLKLIANLYIQRDWEIEGLQAEEILSEVYIRLVTLQRIAWQSREQFLAITSRLMRHVVIDWARRKYGSKRGRTVFVDESEAKDILLFQPDDQLMNLEHALRLLEEVAPRAAQIVELRFFGGLTIEEVSESLEISAATVEKEWRSAKSWLKRQLGT
jgi:RNA polymerase sigma factor (TIGR02999 family)